MEPAAALLSHSSVPRVSCAVCAGVGSKPFEGKSAAAGTEGGGGGAVPSGVGAVGWEGAR